MTTTRTQLAFLALLLGGSGVNLAAGVRRPFVEHRLLSQGYYPAADAAAAAVQRLVPADAPVALVTWDGDMLDELDCAQWADYRFKWLLYPRRFDVYRTHADGRVVPAAQYSPLAVPQALPEYRAHPYRLLFRVTRPPQPCSPGREGVLAAGEMWLLEGPAARPASPAAQATPR